eukprot:7385678-Prymnesium_polylepis.2
MAVHCSARAVLRSRKAILGAPPALCAAVSVLRDILLWPVQRVRCLRQPMFPLPGRCRPGEAALSGGALVGAEHRLADLRQHPEDGRAVLVVVRLDVAAVPGKPRSLRGPVPVPVSHVVEPSSRINDDLATILDRSERKDRLPRVSIVRDASTQQPAAQHALLEHPRRTLANAGGLAEPLAAPE